MILLYEVRCRFVKLSVCLLRLCVCAFVRSLLSECECSCGVHTVNLSGVQKVGPSEHLGSTGVKPNLSFQFNPHFLKVKKGLETENTTSKRLKFEGVITQVQR